MSRDRSRERALDRLRRFLSGQHGFHIYDALIVAAALEADCATLYTEDLQSGQAIDGRLTIRNPFTA